MHEGTESVKEFKLDVPLVQRAAIETILTPFRDDIWNRHQVSVGDRGGPSHTTQKPSGICPPGTHARQNEVMCDQRAIKYGYTYSSAKK